MRDPERTRLTAAAGSVRLPVTGGSAMVLVYWANSPDIVGILVAVLVWPRAFRTALDLYRPSNRWRTNRLVRYMGIREWLGWTQVELTRCESLASGGTASPGLTRAREEVARLEAELDALAPELRAPDVRHA